MRSVELAHVYRAELEADGGLEAWSARLLDDSAMVAWEGDPIVLLFVDDYPATYSPSERVAVATKLSDEARAVGVDVDAVAFESSCAAVADVLAAQLPHGDWWLERTGDGHHRAVLIKKEEPGLWTCPALAAIWTLARLGVEPYREAVLAEAVQLTGRFEAETILTVLPVTYIDVEAAVVEIIRQLRTPRIPLSRVQYVLA